MLTQQQIDHICEDLGGALDGVWYQIGYAHGITGIQVDPDSFEERKNDFFFIIGKLLDEGLLKLGNRKGEFFTGTTAELVDKFRSCFPASDEELIKGIWLVIEECPFVAVWVHKGEGKDGEDYHEWAF
ncbi:hypothetical protein B9J09_03955 [Xylella fastidiosa subsp. pauca]|uniref:DUF596 domain-containing protein n=1 Tax=Xylella fastidiosa TaxID=2371 RepID=UPI000582DD5E|nr:DUF596 domain-containing protein [Xylella fastidiosa]ARO69663.1 hypothetical protein B9J09_03955 [Xylella fastidiosa subsp. pauca]AVI23733.1 hypothetical protein BC375_03780 [Xylella fastidiosa]KIA57887.1 hypothetical protein RA12_09320 [Xylella fastidiosa]KXB09846.1 hypothetical protein ADT32_11285 [Xylella fastidiosa]KXB14117.1 hypothetical protein ADT33_07200 [Xylella fastidiosa]